jgi:hypothetical protein
MPADHRHAVTGRDTQDKRKNPRTEGPLGVLEQADAGSFTVRTRDGKLVVIPAGRALAGKVVPPPPARRRHPGPTPP